MLAINEGTMYAMDGGYPQWEEVGICHLLELSVNDSKYDIVVAKDGCGNYLTVQAAVDSAPFKSNTSYRIKIEEGVYDALVNVPSHAYNVVFIGDGINETISDREFEFAQRTISPPSKLPLSLIDLLDPSEFPTVAA